MSSSKEKSGAWPGRSPLAVAARQLVAAARRGILCTLLPEEGIPYGSIVDVVALPQGDLVMFLSALAEHRKALSIDPRASILVAPSFMEPDALARPRVTLVGEARQVAQRESLVDLYLAGHPEARQYISFPDFQFYRLHVIRARYIAGFGKMGWIDEREYRVAGPVSQ